MIKKLIIPTIILCFFQACIPARQVEELQGKYDSCDTERKALMTENRDLETTFNELKAEAEMLTQSYDKLVKDTTVLGTSLRKMTKQYDKINKLNDELLEKMALLQKGTEAENKKLLQELDGIQNDLQRREDELVAAEKELAAKQEALKKLEDDLNAASDALDKSKEELKKREQRVNELEDIIAQKDAAVKALKDKLTEALLGFKDKGLTVEQKNGKIYVSMEAKLLFGKGSTKVDTEGQKALIELAKVLQDQQDLGIVVEGHTDSDKLSGTGVIKDNWDLSVMRATSVVKIMLANSSINPLDIAASGKGEHQPIDPADTEEAKSKNRRIEVILTPNLDKLFQIIETHE